MNIHIDKDTVTLSSESPYEAVKMVALYMANAKNSSNAKKQTRGRKKEVQKRKDYPHGADHALFQKSKTEEARKAMRLAAANSEIRNTILQCPTCHKGYQGPAALGAHKRSHGLRRKLEVKEVKDNEVPRMPLVAQRI